MTYYPTSTVPAAITYIVAAVDTQIAQDPAAESILLTLADPSEGPDAPNEIIQIGGVRRNVDPASFVGSGGQGSLEEKYDIACAVSVWTGSSDPDGELTIQLEQVQRVWQLLGYVETAIRLDPSLGDLVQISYPKTTTQPEVTWTDTDPIGTSVAITFAIHVEAVI